MGYIVRFRRCILPIGGPGDRDPGVVHTECSEQHGRCDTYSHFANRKQRSTLNGNIILCHTATLPPVFGCPPPHNRQSGTRHLCLCVCVQIQR